MPSSGEHTECIYMISSVFKIRINYLPASVWDHPLIFRIATATRFHCHKECIARIAVARGLSDLSILQAVGLDLCILLYEVHHPVCTSIQHSPFPFRVDSPSRTWQD